jgi:hypothetical protein
MLQASILQNPTKRRIRMSPSLPQSNTTFKQQSTNVIDYCQVKGPAGTGPNGNLYFGKTGSGEDGKFALKKFSVEQIVSVNEAV